MAAAPQVVVACAGVVSVADDEALLGDPSDELAERTLVLFHHEPIYDDRMIERILGETRRWDEISGSGKALTITSAYDGLEIAV